MCLRLVDFYILAILLIYEIFLPHSPIIHNLFTLLILDLFIPLAALIHGLIGTVAVISVENTADKVLAIELISAIMQC